jgi:hypothetical protein
MRLLLQRKTPDGTIPIKLGKERSSDATDGFLTPDPAYPHQLPYRADSGCCVVQLTVGAISRLLKFW